MFDRVSFVVAAYNADRVCLPHNSAAAGVHGAAERGTGQIAPR